MTSTGYVELYSSSLTGLRAQAVAAADEIVRGGQSILVIGLDSLCALDDAVVSALALASSKVREAGGTVRLVTRNLDHLTTLAMRELDRIFDVFLTTELAMQPVRVSSQRTVPQYFR
jgi:anti-anti-sigma regulatory factor